MLITSSEFTTYTGSLGLKLGPATPKEIRLARIVRAQYQRSEVPDMIFYSPERGHTISVDGPFEVKP